MLHTILNRAPHSGHPVLRAQSQAFTALAQARATLDNQLPLVEHQMRLENERIAELQFRTQPTNRGAYCDDLRYYEREVRDRVTGKRRLKTGHMACGKCLKCRKRQARTIVRKVTDDLAHDPSQGWWGTPTFDWATIEASMRLTGDLAPHTALTQPQRWEFARKQAIAFPRRIQERLDKHFPGTRWRHVTTIEAHQSGDPHLHFIGWFHNNAGTHIPRAIIEESWSLRPDGWRDPLRHADESDDKYWKRRRFCRRKSEYARKHAANAQTARRNWLDLGHMRVLRRIKDDGRGAARYVTKYVTKDPNALIFKSQHLGDPLEADRRRAIEAANRAAAKSANTAAQQGKSSPTPQATPRSSTDPGAHSDGQPQAPYARAPDQPKPLSAECQQPRRTGYAGSSQTPPDPENYERWLDQRIAEYIQRWRTTPWPLDSS